MDATVRPSNREQCTILLLLILSAINDYFPFLDFVSEKTENKEKNHKIFYFMFIPISSPDYSLSLIQYPRNARKVKHNKMKLISYILKLNVSYFR